MFHVSFLMHYQTCWIVTKAERAPLLCLQDLWEKAKAAGNEGDADAASRLAHMCATLHLSLPDLIDV